MEPYWTVWYGIVLDRMEPYEIGGFDGAEYRSPLSIETLSLVAFMHQEYPFQELIIRLNAFRKTVLTFLRATRRQQLDIQPKPFEVPDSPTHKWKAEAEQPGHGGQVSKQHVVSTRLQDIISKKCPN